MKILLQIPRGKGVYMFCGGIFLYADLQSTQSVSMCMGGEAQNPYLKDLLTGDILAV